MTVWTEMAAEIKKILDGAGFTAMGEYTSADSLLHSGEAIGFYGLKGYDVVDEVIGQGGKKLYTEYICHIDLRLMGKAGKYDDMEELQEKCESVMAEVSKNAAMQPKVRLGVREGEKYKVKDLLYGLMLESYNDCAVVLAEHAERNYAHRNKNLFSLQ